MAWRALKEDKYPDVMNFLLEAKREVRLHTPGENAVGFEVLSGVRTADVEQSWLDGDNIEKALEHHIEFLAFIWRPAGNFLPNKRNTLEMIDMAIVDLEIIWKK